MKRSLVGLGILSLVIVLSACTAKTSPSAKTPEASISTNQLDTSDDKMTSDSGAAAAKEIKIDAFSYGFTPNKLELTKGQKVKLVVTNKGGFHDFTAKDFNIHQQLSTSAPTEIEFTPDKAGTFDFMCSVGNHAAQGMKGTIVVN